MAGDDVFCEVVVFRKEYVGQFGVIRLVETVAHTISNEQRSVFLK